jgi:alpha-beta hydrolase superfamily lysophospholipase
MTTLSPSSRTSPKQPEKSSRLTKWSLWMVAVFVGVALLTSLIELYLVFPMLGLHEGDLLLFAHSIGGWVAAVVGWLLLAAAPVTGVVLAVRALRLRARECMGRLRAERADHALRGVLGVRRDPDGLLPAVHLPLLGLNVGPGRGSWALGRSGSGRR